MRSSVSTLRLGVIVSIKKASKRTDINFLWITSDMEDPIYTFWLLQKGGVLADECYVVFTNIGDSGLWCDLINVYGGIKWGSVFLMKVRGKAKPPMVPSQRRLHLG